MKDAKVCPRGTKRIGEHCVRRNLTTHDIKKGDIISYTDMANPYSEAVVLRKEVTKWGPVTHILWLEDDYKDTIDGHVFQWGWQKVSK